MAWGIYKIDKKIIGGRMNNSLIAIVKNIDYSYPDKTTLFRPSKKYPEYIYNDISKIENNVYDSVRESFHLLGLDEENYNTHLWNPLGEFIKPGNNVLLKPNMVMHKNLNNAGGNLCLYTQPGVVSAVIDYVIIALKGKGKIIVGDSPMQECDFDFLLNDSGYKLMIDYYQKKNIDIEIIDFRELTSVIEKGFYYSHINEHSKGVIVNIGENSEFSNIPNEDLEKARISNYDPRILPTHHHDNIHEYYISQYILNADVIINLPKPKSHRKAGMTGALKNFVGANVRKEFLPHHLLGSVMENGDEYPVTSKIHRLQSLCLDRFNICIAEKKYNKAIFWRLITGFCGLFRKIVKKDNYIEGSWYGNHTISKTICDLNKIIVYANKEGILCDNKQRTVFNVADMIVSGEKEGPVHPSPKNVGLIISGFNTVCFDEIVTTIMGFNINKIPTLVNARNVIGKYELINKNIQAHTVSNIGEYDKKDLKNINHFNFSPSSGWKGHIELFHF